MSESPTKLCKPCQQAFSSSPTKEKKTWDHVVFHERPWKAMAQVQLGNAAVMTDCDFCAFVVGHAVAARARGSSALGTLADGEAHPRNRKSAGEPMIEIRQASWFDVFDYQDHDSAAVRLAKRGDSFTTDFFMRIFGISDPRIHHHEAIEHTSTTTSSDVSFKLLSRWIRNCSQNHQRCRKLHTRKDGDLHWLPTRLLKILPRADGTPGRVQVLETAESGLGSDTCYATLSYCWGESPSFLKLTDANLQTFKQMGVPIQALPATFRDAITSTTRLGFQYLWVDALCIVQDSAEDWMRESTSMAKVYSYSSVNLAAAASEDAEGGLFRSRNPASVNGARVDVQWPRVGLEGPCRIVPTDPWKTAVLKSPLLKRAWVFQERLLSCGTVFFAHDMLYWECGELYASELYPGGGPWDMPYRETTYEVAGLGKKHLQMVDDGRFKHIYTAFLTNGEGGSCELDDAIVEPFLHAWASVVVQYSKGSLRFESDKLVAINGVAQQMATIDSKSQYLGGFWQQPSLPLFLLWYRDEMTMRAAIPGAPSWSWASMHCGVRFDFLLEAQTKPAVAVQVIGCSTMPHTRITAAPTQWNKPEASLPTTKLTLRGPLTELRNRSLKRHTLRRLRRIFSSSIWNPESCAIGVTRSLSYPDKFVAVGKGLKLSSIEIDRYLFTDTRVFALKVAEAKVGVLELGPDGPVDCGLLLAPASTAFPDDAQACSRGTFVRVGYFEIDRSELSRDFLDWKSLLRCKSLKKSRRELWKNSRIEESFWQEWDGEDNYTITIL
ncbi:hypothetical protein NLG97_g7557 [Lecanicillium saksenae]|uniref:Uncharacterized protein n=1 Tax=Lecanicillium saksenae TaxID=468837 RepID=A0ACC1QN70_9HYPO|nr:hypothetical protein NLG97_g7557 [Lecanicillium saksenae]